MLRWLQSNRALKEELTVIALSATQSTKEVEVAYELGVDFFLSKSDLSSLPQRITMLQQSWLQ